MSVIYRFGEKPSSKDPPEDDSTDPPVPGKEYELPSTWSHPTGQQHPVRRLFDHDHDLPPVIHRFQKPSMAPSSGKSGQQSDNKSKQSHGQPILDLDPAVPPFIATASTIEHHSGPSAPFQLVSRAKSPRFQGYASQGNAPSTRRAKDKNSRQEPSSQVLSADMDERITERFGRDTAFRDPQPSTPTPRMTMKVNHSIREYVREADNFCGSSSWLGFREVPIAEEVWTADRYGHEDPVEVSENLVVGPYPSKDDYLERHYMLLREDAVAPLRDVISEVQVYPNILEKDSQESAYIYEKVYITGFTFAQSGIAARLTFSLGRIGKNVNWDQSKRLRTGTIVALTPAKDAFKTKCRMAVIAARPLVGLQQNPPEIDVFFGEADEIEIDPQVEWIMVESSNGFYEGHRHTLRALQSLSKEAFPLSEHIVDIIREIDPPQYVQDQPLKDLRALYPEVGADVLDTNILEEWPDLPCILDDSQIEALQQILTKRLAVVQGPPGTGKTFVSVTALEVMLQNMDSAGPPIIVAAHTNHALDQLLRHVARFEPDFIRVGAMTSDVEIIKPRTLYEIKSAIRPNKMSGGLRMPALSGLRNLTGELTELLAPLINGKEVLTSMLFKKYNIINEAQYTSLSKGAKEWFIADEKLSNEMSLWLGDEKVDAERRVGPEDFGVEVEEVDLEFEQLKEIEAESKIVDDEDIETLRGNRVVFSEPWKGRKGVGVSEQTARDELKKRDMWEIPTEYRGPVYNLMARLLKDAICKKFRAKARTYAATAQDAKIGKWEVDYNYLMQARVIGMTTTGLSKYRGLIQSLRPKVILIEEAAEILEGFISVACMPSVEHLILVGDHQQLRGHVNDHGLEGNPFYLDVSMFERLVRNYVDFSHLNRQRRMIPEIRRALKPIYDDLEDHESVHERAPIPGMGVNTFFFSHKHRESNDNQMSKVNHEEADLIVNFFVYLNQNGIAPKEITVLTFYSGQRKLMLRRLRGHSLLRGERFNVVTVDSYQGEENCVVLLSLVRSNERRNIGFLGIENRICVALSRAQRGFYIFGDGSNLCKSSMLWWYVVQAMGQRPCRVGFHLPLTCSKHGNTTYIKDAEDFANIHGGCSIPCRDGLPCGHVCTLNCHSFSHDFYDCPKRCTRKLPCGHPCAQICSATCKAACSCRDNDEPDDVEVQASSYYVPRATFPDRRHQSHGRTSSTPMSRASPLPGGTPTRPHPTSRDFSEDAKAYRDFAEGGHVQADRELAKMAEEAAEARRQKLDKESFDALFGGPANPVQSENTRDVQLLRTETDGQGATRTVYRETYTPAVPEAKSTGREKEVSGGEKEVSRKEEVSLLDL